MPLQLSRWKEPVKITYVILHNRYDQQQIIGKDMYGLAVRVNKRDFRKMLSHELT